MPSIICRSSSIWRRKTRSQWLFPTTGWRNINWRKEPARGRRPPSAAASVLISHPRKIWLSRTAMSRIVLPGLLRPSIRRPRLCQRRQPMPRKRGRNDTGRSGTSTRLPRPLAVGRRLIGHVPLAENKIRRNAKKTRRKHRRKNENDDSSPSSLTIGWLAYHVL